MLDLLTRAEIDGATRLRVAVRGRDAVRVAALSALIAATGHSVTADEDAADLLLSDKAEPVPVPLLILSDVPQDAGLSALPASVGVAALAAALRAVAAGLIVRAPAAETSPVRPVLTPRELEILGCLGDGLSNKAVARRLGISQHTVKFHLEAVFTKLGANSRAEAVAKGLRGRLLLI